jgi:hypothetical protein
MSARNTPRQPWFHRASGFWCAQIKGKRIYLDRDGLRARRKLQKLLAEAHRDGTVPTQWLAAPFSDLADLSGVFVMRRSASSTSWRSRRANARCPWSAASSERMTSAKGPVSWPSIISLYRRRVRTSCFNEQIK